MNSLDLKNEIENNPSKSFQLNILRHERLGDGVTRTICDVEGVEVVRIVQVMYGNHFGYTWRVDCSIVSNKASDFLENLYQSQLEDKIIPVVYNRPK